MAPGLRELCALAYSGFTLGAFPSFEIEGLQRPLLGKDSGEESRPPFQDLSFFPSFGKGQGEIKRRASGPEHTRCAILWTLVFKLTPRTSDAPGEYAAPHPESGGLVPNQTIC